MTADDVAKAVATRNPYCSDGANVVCFWCGYYRDYAQSDGLAGRGAHKPECLHKCAKELLST